MMTFLIAVLIVSFMECLLSLDNAFVLAIKVRSLPVFQQKKALFYGLWGAYIFRAAALAAGAWLIKIDWVTLAGAAYLAWIVIKHYAFTDKDENETPDVFEKGRIGKILTKCLGSISQFWKVVIGIELLDIAFSIDSIIAAFGVSTNWWVVVIGGCVGILAMRGVANVFIKLLKKFPELEQTAYVLIAVIAIKMALSYFGFHLNEFTFLGIITAIFGGTFVVSAINKKRNIHKAS